MIVKLLLYISCFLAAVACVGAFIVPSRVNHANRQALMSDASTHSSLRRTMSENPLEGGELLSTLAGLDREWRAQQLSEKDSRWSKIVLPIDNSQRQVVSEQAAAYESYQDFVYLLEPKSKNPEYVFSFTGGAGLGQFPQVAYNEFLVRVSDKLNAAIITSPYQVGLDHYYLSKVNGERLRKAYAYCIQTGKLPENLPIYCLAHSLGGKLQTIYAIATRQKYDGLGFMAFNNFSFSQTMSMAKDFSNQIQGRTKSSSSSVGRPAPSGQSDLMSTIFGVAELAIGAIGLDFTPSQAEMNQLIQLRYTDDDQKKTRLFIFDSDTLDSSRDFVNDCRNGVGLSVSGLAGNHLTPVYFEESKGGISSGSFGKQQDLEALVDEVCSWVKGEGPSRGPIL